jgi:hypothetical protein
MRGDVRFQHERLLVRSKAKQQQQKSEEDTKATTEIRVSDEYKSITTTITDMTDTHV